MRHYYGYREDGALGSIHTFQCGWPDHMDLCDPDTLNEVVQKMQVRMAEQGMVGFVGFDCPCPSDVGSCGCTGKKHAASYVKDGELVDRPPTTSVQLDGVDVDHDSQVARTPGDKIKLRVSAPDIEDGQVATVSFVGAIINLQTQHSLTITAGLSEEVEVTVPAQGAKARVSVGGVQVSVMWFDLIGFA
jgi:hypothetical protein